MTELVFELELSFFLSLLFATALCSSYIQPINKKKIDSELENFIIWPFLLGPKRFSIWPQMAGETRKNGGVNTWHSQTINNSTSSNHFQPGRSTAIPTD